MPFSEVSILKMAFARLGQSVDFDDGDGLVASLDVDEPNLAVHIQQAQLWYEIVRDLVGRDFSYGATTKYALLALADDGTGETWADTWENAWVYPSDCLFLRGFVMPFGATSWPDGPWPTPWSWPLRTGVAWIIGTHGGAKVVFASGADTTVPLVEYTVKQADAADNDVDLGFAQSLRLAAYLAPTLIRGEEAGRIRMECMGEYRVEIDVARRASASESEPYTTGGMGYWMQSRNG